MIRFNVHGMIKLLEQKSGRRITLKEICEKSGADKNALSRLVNQPNIMPSAALIDKLVQYFFTELRPDDPTLHQHAMKTIIKNFICVYPDDMQFWSDVPCSLRDNPHVSLDSLWELYTSNAHKTLHQEA